MTLSQFFPASDRWKSDVGWLKSNFSFSFADYYDPQKMGFGTLRVINDDTIAAKNGFGMHQHANMEIITIPLAGTISHKDSMGNAGEVGRWEVQSMSAGTGIFHSEINESTSENCELFQIWLQTRKNNITPQYSQVLYTLNIWKWVLLSGPIQDLKIAFINQDAYISRRKTQAGEIFSYTPYLKENAVYIMNISWSFSLWEYSLERRDAVGIFPEGEKVELLSENEGDILVIEVPQQ